MTDTEAKAPTAALIARLESADGPSRELDWAIAESLGWTRCQVGQVIACYAPGDPHMKAGAPRYTASIDAALTLVPEGWHMSVNTTVGALLQGSAAVRDRDGGPSFASAASTPALALAAAALKARGV